MQAHAIKLFAPYSRQLQHSIITVSIMLHRLAKGATVVFLFFFRSMNNCFHANVVIVDSTSFQVDYLFYCIILNQVKKSQAGAVKTLLNTDLIKIFLPPPPQKFLRTPELLPT